MKGRGASRANAPQAGRVEGLPPRGSFGPPAASRAADHQTTQRSSGPLALSNRCQRTLSHGAICGNIEPEVQPCK